LTGIGIDAGRALAWWIGELRALQADAAHRLRDIAGSALTIEAGERRWRVRRRHALIGEIDWDDGSLPAGRQRLRELIGGAGRASAVVVEIPPERVLSKLIDLPAGAKDELDHILEFEIARHFPFPAERIFYRYRLADRGGEQATALRVEIVAVARDVVGSIIDELTAAGLRASAISLVAAGNAAPLFLPPDALAPAAAPKMQRRLVVLLVVLALAAAASWPLAQRVRLTAVEREIAALKPAAEAVSRARQESRRAADRDGDIARLRAGRPALIALVDTLSRELPDGSWLTSLSIAGRDVLLEGLTPSAATIALALGRNPNFAAVVFRSPIARDAATGLEHFQLGASLAEPPR